MDGRPSGRPIYLNCPPFHIAGMTTSPAFADPLKDRQAAMKSNNKALKVIKGYTKGKGDLKSAVAAAKKIALTAKTIPSLFPQGSGVGYGTKTRAKPAIWKDWDKFKKASVTLAMNANNFANWSSMGDASTLKVVTLFQRRIKLDREPSTVSPDLHRHTAEALEDHPAGIGAELKAAAAVELVNAPQQGHVALTDELGVVDVAQPGSLGHRQDEGHVGPHNVASRLLGAGRPPEDLSRGGRGEPFALVLFQYVGDAVPGVV